MIYVLNSGNLYGTERMALATLAGLTEYRQRVVLAPPPISPGSVLEEARKAGYVGIEYLQNRKDFTKAVLPWFLRYRHIDVIGTGVAQSFICHALSIVMAVRLRQLQVAHGGTEDWHAYGRKKPLNKIPVLLIAVSEFVKQKLIEHGVQRERVRVIENFLTDGNSDAPRRDAFSTDHPDARPLEPSRVRVAVVSRIDPIKRIDVLVDAVLAGGLDDFEFDVYGTGKVLDELRDRVAGRTNVRFHGFVPDVPERIAKCDVLLHLCPDEPFGLAVLEAFLARLVVVVPDAGGAGSLVEDGITGLKFRRDDAADLQRVLLALRDLPAARLQQLADAGEASLKNRFSARAGVQRYREALASMD